LRIDLDGRGSEDATGDSIFDHMLGFVARHGAFDLTIEAKGDLDVDRPHGGGCGNCVREAVAGDWKQKKGFCARDFIF